MQYSIGKQNITVIDCIDQEVQLSQIRKFIFETNIDLYLLTATNQHLNNGPHENPIDAISGFSGEGYLLITKKNCYLWTHPLNLLQAEYQVNRKYFQLMAPPKEPSLHEWLKLNCKGMVLALHPQFISAADANLIADILHSNGGKLKLMHDDRSNSPNYRLKIEKDGNRSIIILSHKYSGEIFAHKYKRVIRKLKEKKVDNYLICGLDEIVWLLNIRGDDLLYTPVVESFLLMTNDKIKFFVEPYKIDKKVAKYLSRLRVEILPYKTFYKELPKLRGLTYLDPKKVNFRTQCELVKSKILAADSIIDNLKSRKNATEIKWFKESHTYDAIALIKFLYWLEKNWPKGISEKAAAQRLLEFRSEDKNFRGNSFASISAFGKNSAIIHYDANEYEQEIFITDQDIYLIDLGGQYIGGTTDVTRTLHFGQPTKEQKRFYTLVLKGHLALERVVFPKGSTGGQIDAFARQFLWSEELDYNHGTGHGVGAYLSVHEGPVAIAPQNSIELRPGMVVSNEPGIYFPEKYGMRIENLELIVKTGNTDKMEKISWYKFQTLTLVPYSIKLIDKNLLTDQEINQIRKYHTTIFDKLKDLLNDNRIRKWLKKISTFF